MYRPREILNLMREIPLRQITYDSKIIAKIKYIYFWPATINTLWCVRLRVCKAPCPQRTVYAIVSN